MHRRRRSCRVVFLGGPKVYACKNWSSPRGGEIINPPGGEIILRKVHPADNEGGGLHRRKLFYPQESIIVS